MRRYPRPNPAILEPGSDMTEPGDDIPEAGHVTDENHPSASTRVAGSERLNRTGARHAAAATRTHVECPPLRSILGSRRVAPVMGSLRDGLSGNDDTASRGGSTDEVARRPLRKVRNHGNTRRQSAPAQLTRSALSPPAKKRRKRPMCGHRGRQEKSRRFLSPMIG